LGDKICRGSGTVNIPRQLTVTRLRKPVTVFVALNFLLESKENINFAKKFTKTIWIMNAIFDYYSVANRFGISDNIVKKVEQEVREEISNDSMIMELHILRALKSYANKHKLAFT